MKRKPYPTLEQCIAMGRKQQKAEPYSKIMKRSKEIPQDPYGGVCVESLIVSNLMESLTRFDFRDLEI